MLKREYLINLTRSKPVNYDGLLIYPVSFGHIYDDIGEDTFYQMLLPFRLTPDCFDIPPDGPFSLFCDKILKDQSLTYLLYECLKLFCPDENLDTCGVTDDSFAIVRAEEDIFHITAEIFDEIGEIILAIAGVERIKIEKPDPSLSERQLDVWQKLKAGRERDRKKNEVTIADQLNICEFGGRFHIPIETLEAWSPWKIKRCFTNIVSKNEYDDSISLYHPMAGDTSGFTKNRHWLEKFKVRN